MEASQGEAKKPAITSLGNQAEPSKPAAVLKLVTGLRERAEDVKQQLAHRRRRVDRLGTMVPT